MPSFPPLAGFGFCPGQDRETPTRLTYRYVPPLFADSAASRVAGALNAAAAQGVLDPLEPREPTAAEPAAHLTAEGWSLWRRLPLYGAIDIHGQERFEWTAYWDGLPCITFASPHVSKLIERALRSTPQHLWAQRHFGRFCRHVHGMGDPNATAMEMVEGDVLEAAPEERVTSPEGLWKVIWAPYGDELDALLPPDETPLLRRIAASRVEVRGGHASVEALELLRWELPATLVPTALETLEAHGVTLGHAQAPVSVVPCLDSDTPLITLGEPGEGLQATVLAPQPPEHWTEERRADLVAYLTSL